MKKRQKIKAEIAANNCKISELHIKNTALIKESLLLSDKEQWFVETEELMKFGREKKMCKVGRIHWKQSFVDQDKPDVPVIVERRLIVMINGEWKI